MKATIKRTTHVNLKPGTPVEVTGYCARVTATFDDATPNARPKEATREVFFGLDDLTFGDARSLFGEPNAEIPADLPKPPATHDQPAKTPTIAPQSSEVGYLADMLNELRNLNESFRELYIILNEHIRRP